MVTVPLRDKLRLVAMQQSDYRRLTVREREWSDRRKVGLWLFLSAALWALVVAAIGM